MPTPEPAPASPSDPAGVPEPTGGRAARPAMRSSDADRDRVAAVLRDAGGDGRLTVAELDDRLDAAYAAVTLRDLEDLTADLVAADHRRVATASGAPGRVAVRGGDGGTRWVIAVMGGARRTGRWRVGRRCTTLSVMGGTTIDLSHAEFDGEAVHLRVVCVMGGAEVRVPDHMNVVVSDVGFMGGNDVRIGAATPDPGGPTLHLHLVSVMGGASVRRGTKPARRDRRDGRRGRRHGGSHGLPPGH